MQVPGGAESGEGQKAVQSAVDAYRHGPPPHTHIHTYTHTYIHIHTHTPASTHPTLHTHAGPGHHNTRLRFKHLHALHLSSWPPPNNPGMLGIDALLPILERYPSPVRTPIARILIDPRTPMPASPLVTAHPYLPPHWSTHPLQAGIEARVVQGDPVLCVACVSPDFDPREQVG